METWRQVDSQAHLMGGFASWKRNCDREYLMELKTWNLLLPFYLQAGIVRMHYKPEGIHWGWEAPTSELRGTFCGHWLWAAAHICRDTGDEELLGKAKYIVSELARCQKANGGRWAFGIPEEYMYRLKNGLEIWAPQYVCHKVMMGLLEMYRCTGNEQALEIVKNCADWFYDFTGDITREHMSDMMDQTETGGIRELWADLYGVTGDKKHLELMKRYERPRLADGLLAGRDMLTNMHANATIPEIHGYARAYEVTGDERFRRVVEAYWEQAVEKRGMFATGGQTNGEIWTPMQELRARLGSKNQEHCVVYNMMRLADYLFRWTGEAKYADYWEKLLWNGVYAQGFWEDDKVEQEGGNPGNIRDVTTISYFLPLKQGSKKFWGSKTEHFWCCHCTVVQANAMLGEHTFCRRDGEIALAQFIPASARISLGGRDIRLELTEDEQASGSLSEREVNRLHPHRPRQAAYTLKVEPDEPASFPLYIRMPAWRAGDIQIEVNGEPAEWEDAGNGFARVEREWKGDQVAIRIPRKLSCVPLPDDPDMVAFVDGPVCLAGLVGEEHILRGDRDEPEGSILTASNEREWSIWKEGFKTCHQPFGIEFKPLYQIGHETYTVYFPVEKANPERNPAMM